MFFIIFGLLPLGSRLAADPNGGLGLVIECLTLGRLHVRITSGEADWDIYVVGSAPTG